ncbi:hypothetical protein KDA14_04535 [Candidatus Saccharibacteria bacterium]|nr:hypothetical protein [Candidatus Saccharibacteria bacterium]
MPSKKSSTSDSTDNKSVTEPTKSTPPWPLITVGVVASVVILAVGAAAWLGVVMHNGNDRSFIAIRHGGIHDWGGFHSSPDREEFRERRPNADITRGVVTAIDGDMLTISGGGKQVKVSRTTETAVRGDKEDVAVNDTVLIIGQNTDNGTMTAKCIMVQNGAEGRAAMFDFHQRS